MRMSHVFIWSYRCLMDKIVPTYLWGHSHLSWAMEVTNYKWASINPPKLRDIESAGMENKLKNFRSGHIKKITRMDEAQWPMSVLPLPDIAHRYLRNSENAILSKFSDNEMLGPSDQPLWVSC